MKSICSAFAAVCGLLLAGCAGGGSGTALLAGAYTGPHTAPPRQEAARPAPTDTTPGGKEGTTPGGQQDTTTGGQRDSTVVTLNNTLDDTSGPVDGGPPNPRDDDPFDLQRTGDELVEAQGRTVFVSQLCQPDRSYKLQGMIEFVGDDPEEWDVWLVANPDGDRTELFQLAFDADDTAPAVTGTPTGSRPTAEGRYLGRIVGRHNGGEAFAGRMSVDLRVDTANNTAEIDLALYEFLRGRFARDRRIEWTGIAVNADGSYRRNAGGDTVDGAFYGPGHVGTGGSIAAPGRNIALAAYAAMHWTE